MLGSKTIQEIRTALAELGTELTPEALEEVLQAAACIAGHLGGEVWVDGAMDAEWGLCVVLDEETQQECWVDLVYYEDDDEEVN